MACEDFFSLNKILCVFYMDDLFGVFFFVQFVICEGGEKKLCYLYLYYVQYLLLHEE
jgi:hypothetical protein